MELESASISGEKVGKTLENSSVLFVLFFARGEAKQLSAVAATEDAELLFNLKCMFLDCGNKSEYMEIIPDRRGEQNHRPTHTQSDVFNTAVQQTDHKQ